MISQSLINSLLQVGIYAGKKKAGDRTQISAFCGFTQERQSCKGTNHSNCLDTLINVKRILLKSFLQKYPYLIVCVCTIYTYAHTNIPCSLIMQIPNKFLHPGYFWMICSPCYLVPGSKITEKLSIQIEPLIDIKWPVVQRTRTDVLQEQATIYSTLLSKLYYCQYAEWYDKSE